MKPTTAPAAALDLATKPCDDCASTMRWERRDLTPTNEAWLGLCGVCGSMLVVVPGATDTVIADPLAYFLLGPEREPAADRPAWQRFYAHTLAPPFSVPWRFQTIACKPCQARSTVATTATTPRWKRTLTLCLNCGFATAATTRNIMDSTSTLLTGGTWAPADPAVKTLRDSIFRTYRDWVAYQEWRRQCLGRLIDFKKKMGKDMKTFLWTSAPLLGLVAMGALFPHSGEPIPVILTLIFLGWFLIMLLGLAINLALWLLKWFLGPFIPDAVKQQYQPQQPEYVEFHYDTIMQVKRGRKQHSIPWGEVEVGISYGLTAGGVPCFRRLVLLIDKSGHAGLLDVDQARFWRSV